MSSGSDQYGDLLIFEESLRKEYARLLVLKRKYTLFFALLIAWNAFFFHGTWVNPSDYSYVLFLYRICLLAGLVTLVLFYASGLYNSTLLQPRKFIPQANRGLRPFNVKLVPTQTGWLSFLRKEKMPGEAHVKLVVSARAGGEPQVREGFEEYRQAYWLAMEEKKRTGRVSTVSTKAAGGSSSSTSKSHGSRQRASATREVLVGSDCSRT
ncbi:Spo7-like protein-domain-containing protein [Protomyces lactucae-debilis]|uniref:Spo7-like protein-domain-containing protein n=1 Tax=Protomyces lactucae-debilis TaxID=2754530 RepID=A0A1Y2EX84_PROLT|nr:Spo7-like protein-domain-containing protein [Protomyces lactucae-debilis]ORY75736.1 Spo7-like protein-domain-containing protein [Protomyces lactucae-debilis]